MLFRSEVLRLDEQRRHALKQVEDLKALRNKVSKEIGALMGQKKLAEAESKKAETRALGDQITALDKSAADAEAALGEVQAVADRAADAVVVAPLDEIDVHPSLEDEVLDEVPHLVVDEGAHQGGAQAEALAQSARHVVLKIGRAHV